MPQIQAQPLALSKSGKFLVLLGVGLGVFMSTLDVGIINVALPSLVQGFHTDFPTTQWAVLSYQLVSSSLVLGATRLGNMWGKKYLYLGGLIVFTLSSLLCGFAPSIEWLIGFRALQGLGSVFISGLGLAIVTEAFPSSERGKAVAPPLAIITGFQSTFRFAALILCGAAIASVLRLSKRKPVLTS